MATYNKFNAFIENAMEGVHNLQSDTLKHMLSNTTPLATNALKSDITEIGAGNGYSAGGSTVTITSSAQTSGTYKCVGADVTWTASGGSIGAFEYVVFYNSTPSSPLKPLISWWDYGSAITILTGESFTADADPTTGLLQAA